MPPEVLTAATPAVEALRTVAGEITPLWYKDAVIYQVHVRAFYDSNGDGIGDFPGLTRSSITCRIWASPRSGCCRFIRRR